MTASRRLITSVTPALFQPMTTRPTSTFMFASAVAVHRYIRASGQTSLKAGVSSVARCGQPLQRPIPATRRWYSAGDETAVPGSKIWSFDEVKQLVEAGKKLSHNDVVIVDVREPVELQSTGKIPGAVNIPITSAVQSFHIPEADFEDMYGFERPSRDSTLLLYCKAGVRAKSAAGLAKHAGWRSVGEYTGSWLDWEANGGPIERVKP
ncbi:hypothetical protein QQS21_004062 [Conoideocrella luteorostrata]|uniref:Rhodanese domain-containing protein n=1 Tax=Conoideocrella luteorostrata TaxID=1105319 RepID=A0AAJ0G048_9HYPO|nr:hypothetical protein QQS21_004062 [Conoideocrella luteorostrata]